MVDFAKENYFIYSIVLKFIELA